MASYYQAARSFLLCSTSLAVFKSLAFADTRDTVQVLSTVKNKINTQFKIPESRKYTFSFNFVERLLKHFGVAPCINQTSVNESDQGKKRAPHVAC